MNLNICIMIEFKLNRVVSEIKCMMLWFKIIKQSSRMKLKEITINIKSYEYAICNKRK